MKVYSIKDSKGQSFSGLNLASNDALIVRDVQSGFESGKLGLINQFPGDFAIYCIGDFDQTTGAFNADLRFVKNISDFVSVSEVKKDA